MSKFVSVAAGLFVAASSLVLVAGTPRVYATATTSSTTTNTACVDGSKRANLSVTWEANDTISFHTLQNKPLCNDVTLFFSSYTMPDNYDGKGFTNNPTATPQQIFDSKSFVMKKGTNGAQTLKVKLPEACKNIQVDLYYAPEITVVTEKGHGVQYITGKIYTKTADECTPETPEEPETPEVPTPEAQTPPTPQPEVIIAETPAELPKTGGEIVMPLVASAGAAAVGYTSALIARKRK